MADTSRRGGSGQALTALSHLAVIAGLVFVGLEIRTNTAAVRSASVQEITSLSAEALADLASDSALAHLRLRGDADPASLSEVESYQYFAYYRGYWLRFQNVYLQRQLGVLEAGVWETYEQTICNDIQTPGVRSEWAAHVGVLTDEFVALVEACL